MDLGLPISWHDDGTPIFEREDIIRPARQVEPDNGIFYDNLIMSEHRHLRPECTFNMIVIPPAESHVDRSRMVYIGKSYPDPKRGYYYGRVIQALDANCRVILQRYEQTKPGYITDFLVLNMQPMQLAVVPPSYETVILNIKDNIPARFFELCAYEEKRDIDTLISLNGPGYLLKKDGSLSANKNYNELSIPRIHPGLNGFRFMTRRSLYEMFTSYPKGFDFIDPPNELFFAGSV